MNSSNNLLSPQQRIIFQYLVDGCTIKEVALSMGIAVATVRKHINKGKVKMSAKTHDHAIALVIAKGEVVVNIGCRADKAGP
jgi:DNA-binding CsgD family transcriptional regulator